MPRDVPTREAANLNRIAINAQDIPNALSDQDSYIIIFLLDCCRKYYLCNPDVDAPDPNANNSRSVSLKAMHRAGSLIAFNCASGTIAIDGKRQRNGVFTKHLLKHITVLSADIRMILKEEWKKNQVQDKCRFRVLH